MKPMKIKKINKGALNTFWIMGSLVVIMSHSVTQDWATAIFQGLIAGFVFSFVYIVAFLMGVEEGKAKGYDKALEDLKPILPPEMQKNMNERNI
ncbi:unnamed protein product [marine sediment metagenome]|uniref:Uncharacterized protein n=1 Tax=marine sediment metagenome TaxID=412755 RepID=X0T8Z3_9ZZZZ